MLNSTKTWQEEFDERFILKKHNDYVDEDSIGEVAAGYGYTNEDIKQFISDLRKKDEQQLLLKLSLETQYYGREIEMKISKIIEEYYVKN